MMAWAESTALASTQTSRDIIRRTSVGSLGRLKLEPQRACAELFGGEDIPDGQSLFPSISYTCPEYASTSNRT